MCVCFGARARAGVLLVSTVCVWGQGSGVLCEFCVCVCAWASATAGVLLMSSVCVCVCWSQG